jgi:HEAT repeat protein
MSVEESYLQESVENMIIREQSRAESRDMQMVALAYIGDAIKNGNASPEVVNALDYMGLEGVINQSREEGRLLNNYPDIRARAADYLGQIGTPAAQKILLKMAVVDPEPMVLTEVIKSLGKIGTSGTQNNGEVCDTISWVVTRFDVLNPDNLLALSALDAFQKIAEKSKSLDNSAIQTIMRISQGNYTSAVRSEAKQLLSALRKVQTSNEMQPASPAKGK